MQWLSFFQKIDKTTVCGCKTDLCNESVSDAAESDGMRWCPGLINLLFAVVIVLKISKCNWICEGFFSIPFWKLQLYYCYKNTEIHFGLLSVFQINYFIYLHSWWHKLDMLFYTEKVNLNHQQHKHTFKCTR